MERNSFLINKKIIEYMIPSILMMAAMQLGNTVDAVLVGNILGSSQMVAIQLCTPVLFVAQFPVLILSGGGAALAAVMLGKRNLKKASQLFTIVMAASIIFAVFFAASSLFLSGPFGRLLTTDEKMAGYVSRYLLVFLLGMPLISMAVGMANFMTVDNNPRLVGMLYIVSNAVNLILDFVLLKYTAMGMYGSACSTVIGYTVGLLFVIPYMRADSRMLRIVPIKRKDLGQLKEILTTGAPEASVVLMIAVRNLIMNTVILRMLGKESMAVYTVCFNAMSIVEMCTGGIIGVMNGLNGILYGEKDHYGVRVLAKKILTISFCVSVMMLALFFMMPGVIASLFGLRNRELISVAKPAIRLFALSFPFYVFNQFLIIYYKSTIRPLISGIVTVLQGFVIIITMSLLGICLMGLNGLCLAAAFSEGLTILFVLFIIRQLQKAKKLAGNDFYSLPKETKEVLYDVSIKNRESEAVMVSQKLIDFCVSHQVAGNKANAIGITAEELCVNICRYGYNRARLNYIDVNLTLQDGILILRLRDDGVPFNPIEYQADEKEMYHISGIMLVKKMSNYMNYMRVLNMNHTVIELNL